MTLQDRDLERALARLADDVVLTATDVDTAFTEFADRSTVAAQRRRTQRLAAACAAAVLLLGGAAAYWAGAGRTMDRLQPATPTVTQPSVISAADMVGVWTGMGLWTFYADGSGGYSNNADTLETPFYYTLKGAKLGVHDGSGCDFSFRLTSYREGKLTGDVLDFCGNNAPPVSLVRLSPASPAGTEIPMFSMAGSTPVRRVAQVGGVWLMPGTGMLLAIDASDPSRVTYALDDQGNLAKSPRDAGAVTVSSDGTVTLTSSQAPTFGCSAPEGPRTVLRDVRVVAAQSLEASGGVTSTCAWATVPAGWVMVSDR
ncbi:hypothetical protein [Phycicoccus sp. Soil802]|uniref:hypothetical protein n=1 Tax=Phycicoccus sp. Soil802 TaxID=1736414 RepID=UPI000702F083|nr:hypothetical protein [Phycicoccus sp. Soil802]KRF29903.1 hypothetical protein ASG91_02650 [Phycicoccus sp. Soil802]